MRVSSLNDPMAAVLQCVDVLSDGDSKAIAATNEDCHKKAHILNRAALLESTRLIATGLWLLDWSSTLPTGGIRERGA